MDLIDFVDVIDLIDNGRFSIKGCGIKPPVAPDFPITPGPTPQLQPRPTLGSPSSMKSIGSIRSKPSGEPSHLCGGGGQALPLSDCKARMNSYDSSVT
jgi:hypothetical protein